MDIIVSYFTMPVGVLFCFGPAIFAWMMAERKSTEAGAQTKPSTKA